MDSIFKILREENLTTLEIRYHYKDDTFNIEASHDWDDDVAFAEYNRTFIADDILTDHREILNMEQFEALLRKHGTDAYFEELKSIIRKGRHEAIKLFYNNNLGIEFAMFEHSTVMGRANRLHGNTCGGIRRHLQSTPEREVFIDGLNLGRAMTFKNAGAKIPFGGSKITIQAEELNLDNNEALGFLGYATDRCHVLTAPDMNLPPSISDKMQEKHYSCSYVGGENSRTGKTGRPTAYGVYLSLKEAVQFREGKGLNGKSVLVIGLGAVGWNMAEFVLDDGAQLMICDIDKSRAEKFALEHKSQSVTIVDAQDAIFTKADVISPCAAGGILDEETIARLQCNYIWGSANNQLKATSIDEEYRLAELLQDKGIMYQAEWWHNSAGVICMAEEYTRESLPDEVLRRVEETIPETTRDNLREAAERGVSPTKNCYDKIESLIF